MTAPESEHLRTNNYVRKSVVTKKTQKNMQPLVERGFTFVFKTGQLNIIDSPCRS